MTKIKSLDKIRFIGKKRRKGEPFPVTGQKGLYFYVLANHAKKLIEINEAYKSLYKKGAEPLEEIKIVGRGGISRFRPFLLKKYKGEYICVLADHLNRLIEINETYGKSLIAEKRKKDKERKRKLEEEKKRAEEKKKLEDERRKAEEERRKREEKKKLEKEKANKAIESTKKTIRSARDVEALKHVPEIMQNAEDLFSKAQEAFKTGKYDKSIEFATKAKEIAENAKIKALKIVEELVKPEEGKYAYCIIESDGERKDFGRIGIENTRVYTIPYKDIAVVVSDLPLKEYEVSEYNVMKHEYVIRKVMEDHTVIPMTFGMVFKNQHILISVLKGGYKAVRKSLKLLDNKIELGVKAILTKEAIDDGEKKEIIDKQVPEIFETLSVHAVRAVKGKLFSDRLVLNASFLVEKDKIEEFSEEVEKLGENHKQLKIQYSGPWAPYNFVNINIGGGKR